MDVFGVVCVWDNEHTLPFCLCSEPAAVPQQIIFPKLLTARPNSACVHVCVYVHAGGCTRRSNFSLWLNMWKWAMVLREDASLSIQDLLKYADDAIKTVTYPCPDGCKCSFAKVKGSILHCISTFHSGKSKTEPIS